MNLFPLLSTFTPASSLFQFLTQKVTKNLFAEVLFQIVQRICKLGERAKFDFWDFV
jgi:hypothetical protein